MRFGAVAVLLELAGALAGGVQVEEILARVREAHHGPGPSGATPRL